MFPLKKEVSERWRDFLCWPLGGSIGPDQLDSGREVPVVHVHCLLTN